MSPRTSLPATRPSHPSATSPAPQAPYHSVDGLLPGNGPLQLAQAQTDLGRAPASL